MNKTNAARLDMFHRPRCTWRLCEVRTEVELALANYRGRLVALTTCEDVMFIINSNNPLNAMLICKCDEKKISVFRVVHK